MKPTERRRVFMLVLLFVGMVLTAGGIAICGYWLSHRYQSSAKNPSEIGNSEMKELILTADPSSLQPSLSPKTKKRSPPHEITYHTRPPSANAPSKAPSILQLAPRDSFIGAPMTPGDAPSKEPVMLSERPNDALSATPSNVPSDLPSDAPSDTPSDQPSYTPTSFNSPTADYPSGEPSDFPSKFPSLISSYSMVPAAFDSKSFIGMPSNAPRIRGGGVRNK